MPGNGWLLRGPKNPPAAAEGFFARLNANPQGDVSVWHSALPDVELAPLCHMRPNSNSRNSPPDFSH